MKHTCHWPGCATVVPPAMWGCKAHWFRLPKAIKKAANATDHGKPWGDSIAFARAIESAVRAEYADVPHEEWNGEGWESLAWHLCAEENGEDACNDLLWVGGAVPEPWGDRWQRYEGDAKRMIRLVKEHYNPKIGGEE